jgi:hypothetical protein
MARKPDHLSSASPLTIDPEREQRVRERAYAMWESDGKPHGRDVEYWERAREMIGREESASSGLSKTPQKNPASLKQAETDIRQNLGEDPGRAAEPGDVKAAAPAKRRARAKPKKS